MDLQERYEPRRQRAVEGMELLEWEDKKNGDGSDRPLEKETQECVPRFTITYRKERPGL